MIAVEPGAVLGPIQLRKILRKDAIANVYEGHHMRLGADVAVSVTVAAPGEDPDRFLAEARKATEVRHPGLVRVLDFGEHGELRYLVTALTQGTTLEQHLAEHKGPLAERVIVRVIAAVAEALGAAHAVGLAHRDLRPSRVLFDRRGQIKLMDLSVAPGVAVLPGPESGFEERSQYLPPECAKDGAPLGAAADLYALGVIAYELAFQRPPYRWVEQDRELLEPARLDLPTHCAPELIAVIAQLIELDPAARIQTVAELLAALPAESASAAAEENPPVQNESRTPLAPEFGALVRMLQRRFGSATSDSPIGTVVHSTLRERLLVWGMVLVLGGTVVAGFLAR